jgi:hypothetical protein
MILVLSTGLHAPTKDRCLASVNAAVAAYDWERHHIVDHVYIEASKDDPPKGASQNVVETLGRMTMKSTDVVVSLDGDDWLAHDQVLNDVAARFEDPNVWLSWGSFRYADGREGFASDIPAEEWSDLRRAPWRLTHLKCYRFGLFAHLGDAELRRADGSYRTRAWDQAMMLPMAEMAGPEHSRFVKDVSYVYNYASSYEFTQEAAGLAAEQAEAAEIRRLPPRQRLAAL